MNCSIFDEATTEVAFHIFVQTLPQKLFFSMRLPKAHDNAYTAGCKTIFPIMSESMKKIAPLKTKDFQSKKKKVTS